MAKKVFRIHTQGASNSDWFSSTEINHNLIESIETDSGDGKKLPTSIPSPFARIDLVRTAFSIVADSGNLDGTVRNGVSTATDNHKLVSDALDIGQIFFNYDKLKDKLSLQYWDRQGSLEKLLNGNSKQKHLGNTLKLFLEQDSEQYNFGQFDKLYVLKYKNKIIGGTSPRTMFIAAPNAKETDISFGQDIMLDDRLLPLYKREKEYIKYLYSLTRAIPNFNSNFPEINHYIQKNIDKLYEIDHQLHDELHKMDSYEYLKKLKEVVYNNNAGEPLSIIRGLPLKQFVKDPKLIEAQSDFVIKTDKIIQGLKPLVLPVSSFSHGYRYTTDKWDARTEVPVEDKRPLNQRTLPGQEDQYPYLTMNDFLEDQIIRLPHEIDSTRFFTMGDKQYLLPLKKAFFDYFSVDDLKSKKLIESKKLAGDNLEIKLNIPIKTGFISYSKIYFFKNESVHLNRDSKKGIIRELEFALSIYPFVTSTTIPINHTIGFARSSDEGGAPKISCLNTSISKKIPEKVSKQRSSITVNTYQHLFEENFDLIFLGVDGINSGLIPNFEQYTGSSGDNYEFSIDFGTTNTHIEYKIQGQGSERAFDIKTEDQQLVNLLPSDKERTSSYFVDIEDLQSYLIQETLDEMFGEHQLVQTPFRTCLLQNVTIDYDKPTHSFADVNVGFDYEKRLIRKYLKELTDLKWAQKNKNNNRQVKHFIQGLLLLCKNKVLMNNGNLTNTKINWFYPVSMTTNHLNLFKATWQEAYQELFSMKLDNINSYPESIGPFYFYKAKGGIPTMTKPSVSIDIGGGTTDIMIFIDGKPQLISSFKFAGDSIFGDGFNNSIENNGFIKVFKNQFDTIIKSNGLAEEGLILEQIYNRKTSSSELLNFFFSLKNNKKIKDLDLELDFGKMLSHSDDFKIVFLLFHAAIIYHVAEMMKIKGFDTPRNIVYSGTGSKTLKILDSGIKLNSLEKLFQEIFNSIYDVTNSDIDITYSSNPKEVTAKGGFYIKDGFIDIDHNELVEMNIGDLTNQIVQNKALRNVETVTYAHLNEAVYDGVIRNVEHFFKVFDKINVLINFNNLFGVSHSSYKTFGEIRSKDLKDYLLRAMDDVHREVNEDETIGETLFFYPLIGLLNKLSSEIGGK